MKTASLILCLALVGCGYSKSYSVPRIGALSDAELMTAHAAANAPLTALTVPQQREWTLAEMKRRGLVGPGRDGIPQD